MAMASGVGVTLATTRHAHAQGVLFGEDQARYLVATDRPETIVARALEAGVPVEPVGEAGGDAFACGELFAIPLTALSEAHERWMPAYMESATGA
jgi:phosphoribosylformylglycinamidine synthase